MQTVTLLNEKGGIGKTTMSMTLATEAARAGLKVVMIDADQQASTTKQFRVKPYPGFYNLIGEEKGWGEVLTPIDSGWYEGPENHLLLLGSNTLTAQLQGLDIWKQTGSSTHYLAERIDELNGWADLIVIDTAPGVSDIHAAVYQAADHILMPTLCARMSVEGIQQSLKHLRQVEKILAPGGIHVADVLGILPTMFYGRELVQHQTLGQLQGKYGEDKVFRPIKRRATWEQASAQRIPVSVYEPNSDAAREAKRFANEVLNRIA